MSPLDIWFGTVWSAIWFIHKACFCPSFSSHFTHFTLALHHIILSWNHISFHTRIPNFTATFWILSFPEYVSGMSNSLTFLDGCIWGTSISTGSKLNFFCLLLLHILLGVAPVNVVPAGSPAPHLHSRPRNVQRGNVRPAVSFYRMRSRICCCPFCSLPLALVFVTVV